MRLRKQWLCLVLAVMTTAACGHRTSREDLLSAYGNLGPGATEEVSTEVGGPTAGVDGVDGGPAATTSGPTTPGQAQGQRPGQTTSRNDGTGSQPVAACATPGETGPLLIGSVGNYSGPAGSSLLPVARSLQVWAQWVNRRGGLCGRQVQIAVVDDHSDPAQHRAALRDLAENRGAIAFGNAASLTGESGIAYLEGVKVPAIGGGCAVEKEYASFIHFLTCPRPSDQYYGTAKNAVLFGPPSKKFGLITCREVHACGAGPRQELIDREGAKKAGADLVYSAESSITQPDYTAECRGAEAAGAEVVSLMLDAASVRRFGQSCTRQGYQPVFSQLSATVTSDTKDQVGLGNLIVTMPTFPFSATETPAHKEFRQAMAELYRGSPGPGESMGWATGKMIELAITNAGKASRSITAATVLAALQGMKDETLGGLIVPVTYRPNAAGVYPSCWFAVKASGGQWTTLNDAKPICR